MSALHKFFFRSRLQRSLLIAFAVITSASVARATAPEPQKTNAAPGSTLHSVVEMMKNQTPLSINDYVGTGSVIDKWIYTDFHDDVQPQTGYFCVITAAHNFPKSGYISFGDAGAVGVGDGRDFHRIVKIHLGGSTGTKDLALAIVEYGTPDAFFNNVSPLGLWNAPVGVSDTDLAGNFSEYLGGFDFTEIGYGNTGTRFPAVPPAAPQTGWTPVNSAGTQRFQNETIDSLTPNNVKGAYTYLSVDWTTNFPAAGSGEGSSFPGDSGGPYLVSALETLAINGLLDIDGNPLPAQNIDLHTDTIFAVHTFGNNLNPQLFGAKPHGGVVLTADDIQWITNNCQTIPEASTIVMVGLGVAAIALGRYRRLSGD